MQFGKVFWTRLTYALLLCLLIGGCITGIVVYYFYDHALMKVYLRSI